MGEAYEIRAHTVLVVEDCEEDCEIYRRILSQVPFREYRFLETYEKDEAFRLCHSHKPDCILLDFNLPGYTGLEFIEEFQEVFDESSIPIIMLTGGGDTELAVQVLKAGAFDYIAKDQLSSGSLSRAIERAIEKSNYQLALAAKEQELLDALREARDANQLKSKFLSNMSHEIRTPMNGILGLTDMALEENLSTEVREMLELVRTSADHLLYVINDILDFSKIEAGKFTLSQESFSLYSCIGDALGICAFQARQKQLEVRSVISSDLPKAIFGDAPRLKQVLINLLGNAVKFTPEKGTIEISASVEKASKNGVTVHFMVDDSGVGIPEEKQSSIFEPFAQLEERGEKLAGGTGLGLTICKRIVELMNGKIWVENKVEPGCCFHVVVPFDVRGEDSSTNRKTIKNPLVPSGGLNASARSLSILVAEDNVVNQKVVVRLLQKLGHRATVVENGKQSVDAYEKGEFDLILMDIQMPEMDGLEAMRNIRTFERHTDKRVPIIALTAYAMSDERERFLNAGMDAYVSKPVKKQDLVRAIRNVLV